MSANHSVGPFTDGMRFVFWMRRQKRPVTFHEVMEEFEVSRATAFRWLSEYEQMTACSRVLVEARATGNPGSKSPTGLIP